MLRITVVKRNIVANLAGSAWATLAGFIVVPLYIKVLGIEAWGLVGFFISLQGIFAVLDMGLSATMTREMARLSAWSDNAQDMRDLVRTLEVLYWAVGALIGGSVFILAPLIVDHWIGPSRLSSETIQHAIRIMGLAMSLQWPVALYTGGLLGLQRQVLLNAINVGTVTLRYAGAIAILCWVSPTLEAFFLWQAVAGMTQTCLVAWFLWRILPKTNTEASFQSGLLRSTWRITAGMSGIVVISLILTHMDKIILSRLLSLEMFGYYVLAATAAAGAGRLVLPVFYAVYPRLTQLVSLGDEDATRRLYHRSCQVISVLILPACMVIAFFSKEVLLLWTGNPAAVEYGHLLLSILMLGTALNCLMHVPHALQLAHGWTTLAFYLNLLVAVIVAPAIALTTPHYGAIGAAVVSVTVNGALALLGIRLMHRRLLRGEQRRWYVEDVGLPLAVSLGAAFVYSSVVPRCGTRFQLLIFLLGAGLFTTGSTLLATPVTSSHSLPV